MEIIMIIKKKKIFKKITYICLSLASMDFSSEIQAISENENEEKKQYVNIKINNNNPLDKDDFVKINESQEKIENKDDANLNIDQFFSRQNKNFTREQMDSLIKRGQQIIQDLLNKEAPENIYNKRGIKIFEANVSKFFESYYNHAPGIEQLKKVGKTLLRWIPGVSSYVSEKRPFHDTLRRQQLLEDVIAVSWAIAYAPCTKSQGFIRGSFSIKDDDKLLSNFLKYYAMEAAEVQSRELDDLAYPTNPQGSYFAYNRTGDFYSSHYIGQTIYQIGIDTRFESNGYALKVLPYEYKHIIFGRVRTIGGKEKTFFKLEEEGLGDISSTLGHVWNYMKPIENSQSMRREKDIPINSYSRDDLEYRTGNEMILNLEDIGLESR